MIFVSGWAANKKHWICNVSSFVLLVLVDVISLNWLCKRGHSVKKFKNLFTMDSDILREKLESIISSSNKSRTHSTVKNETLWLHIQTFHALIIAEDCWASLSIAKQFIEPDSSLSGSKFVWTFVVGTSVGVHQKPAKKSCLLFLYNLYST